MSPDSLNIALSSFRPVCLQEICDLQLSSRFDIKYTISANKAEQFLEKLRNYYCILEIDRKRSFSYSTIYFDTDDFLFYNQHVKGKLERNKVRIRKYNDSGISFLEVKKKTNRYRTIKYRSELSSGDLFASFAPGFVREHIPGPELTLSPVIINSFRRLTLCSQETCERITMDFNLKFTRGENAAEFPFISVIEQKYV